HAKFLHPRLRRIIGNRPRGDPLANRLVLGTVGPQPHAATVFGLSRRLLEEQARGGVVDVHAAPAELAQEALVIASGIGAEERQPEAVLALHRTVARPAVAPEFAE